MPPSPLSPSKFGHAATHPLLGDGNTAQGISKNRITLWQRLFGQNNKSARRSTHQQAKAKQRPKDTNRLLDDKESVTSRQSIQSLRSEVAKRVAAVQQNGSKLSRDRMTKTAFGRPQPGQDWRSGQDNGRGGSMISRLEPAYRSPAAQYLAARQAQAQPLSLHPSSRTDSTTATSLRQRRERRHPGRSAASTSLRAQPDPLRQRESTPTRPRSRSASAGLYAARMLILSVGVGVLVGTLLSVWDPASRSPAGASQKPTAKSTDVAVTTSASQAAAIAPTIQTPALGQELTPLKASLQALALQNPRLTPGIFLLDLDTNSYVDLNGGASFGAASTIKVPILVAFFQDVDAGKIRLDELLTMRKELIAGGSGELQGLPAGTQITALETVIKMITISDNTATNMIIARLGGMATLNERFKSWGLVSTAINNLLPDLQGTNTTSPKDMALLMTRISQGDLVSIRSRDRLLGIMQKTVNTSQLPQGLEKGATIAHKTGDIGTVIGDVGLIDMPSGKRYSLTVLVKRSFNDGDAYDLVQKISRISYQYLKKPQENQSHAAGNPPLPSNADPGTPSEGQSSPNGAVAPARTTLTQAVP